MRWDALHLKDCDAGDMTAESGDDKLGDNSGDSIVTVTMEPDTENNQEDNDNAAEAQDYFKEGYSSELAQVYMLLLFIPWKYNFNYTI